MLNQEIGGPVNNMESESHKKRKNADSLFKFLKKLKDSKFTGRVIIDFSQGGIGNIEKTEKIKY